MFRVQRNGAAACHHCEVSQGIVSSLTLVCDDFAYVRHVPPALSTQLVRMELSPSPSSWLLLLLLLLLLLMCCLNSPRPCSTSITKRTSSTSTSTTSSRLRLRS